MGFLVVNLVNFLCRKTVSALMKETGCKLENPAASTFRENILNGDWDKVLLAKIAKFYFTYIL